MRMNLTKSNAIGAFLRYTIMYWSLLVLSLVGYTSGFRSVCFYWDRVQHRNGTTRLMPKDIDTNLCTHIVFGLTKLEDLVATRSDLDYNQEMHDDIMTLKSSNPLVKILIAIGDPMNGSHGFVEAVQTDTSRLTFARNVVSYLRKENFDGIHLDWEHTTAEYGITADYKEKFVRLLQEIRGMFDRDASLNAKSRYILATSVPAKRHVIDNGYDVPNIVKYTDFISLKTLNFHTSSDNKVGLNSPLYANTQEQGSARFLNVDWVARYYVSLGAPKDKINIGIPTYGQTFSLRYSRMKWIGSPSLPQNAKDGIIGFSQVCGLIKDGAFIVNVPSQRGRYLMKNNTWVTYEDVLSVLDKACYTKNNTYGGVTFWSIDLDDFSGSGCRLGKYPLITTVYNIMKYPGLNQCGKKDSTTFVTVPQPSSQMNIGTVFSSTGSKGLRVVCYYMSSAKLREGKGLFQPEDIDPNLCTHLIFLSAKIVGLQLAPLDQGDESTQWKEGMYQRAVKLKQINPNLKVLLSIGDQNSGSAQFVPITRHYHTRATFAGNVVSFLRQRRFDGIDVNWQFPSTEYRHHFTFVMQHLKSKINLEASSTGNPPLLLSALLSARKMMIDTYYDVSKLVRNTDFISIMTYDYHGSWDGYVGINSPLYSQTFDIATVDFIAKYYVSLLAPKYQINIGIATFGRSSTLLNSMVNGIGSPSTTFGNAGPITKRLGLLSHYEVCDIINSGGKVEEDSVQRSRYVYKGDQWVSFEDEKSVADKACYAKLNGFGGVMIWSIDEDDFSGASCYQGKYPLLSTAYDIMQTENTQKCVEVFAVRDAGSHSSHSLGTNFTLHALLLWILRREPPNALLLSMTLGLLLYPAIA